MAGQVGHVDAVLPQQTFVTLAAAIAAGLSIKVGAALVVGVLALHVVHGIHKIFETAEAKVVVHSITPIHQVHLCLLHVLVAVLAQVNLHALTVKIHL